MGKEIRIIKKDNHEKFEDYTFIDNNNIELKKIDNENDSNSTSSSNDKKHKEHDFKLKQSKEGLEGIREEVKASGRSEHSIAFFSLRIISLDDNSCNLFIDKRANSGYEEQNDNTIRR